MRTKHKTIAVRFQARLLAIPIASPDAFATPRRRHRRLWLALILGICGLSAASVLAFREAGAWLIVEDPPPAHAIVVLSGGMPSRAREAGRIYRQSFAAQVWVSPGLTPAPGLEALGIAYVGESFYNQRC